MSMRRKVKNNPYTDAEEEKIVSLAEITIITKSAQRHVVWGQSKMTRRMASNGNPRNVEPTRGRTWSGVDCLRRNAGTMALGGR